MQPRLGVPSLHALSHPLAASPRWHGDHAPGNAQPHHSIHARQMDVTDRKELPYSHSVRVLSAVSRYDLINQSKRSAGLTGDREWEYNAGQTTQHKAMQDVVDKLTRFAKITLPRQLEGREKLVLIYKKRLAMHMKSSGVVVTGLLRTDVISSRSLLLITVASHLDTRDQSIPAVACRSHGLGRASDSVLGYHALIRKSPLGVLLD